MLRAPSLLIPFISNHLGRAQARPSDEAAFPDWAQVCGLRISSETAHPRLHSLVKPV